jgi:hypothetical protein
VGHERGPKIRVLKFKPKKGYKRRTGHRQELTRLEVTEIKLAARAASGAKKATKAEPSGETKAARPKTAARKPARAKAGTARKPASGGSTAKK